MVFKKVILKENQNIWFTSDTHAYHKNITKGETSWDNSVNVRDFDTTLEMTQAIIDGINNNVKANDILAHLGDWSFGGYDKIELFRSKINCKNILLILGNHDDHISRESKLFKESLFNQGVYSYANLVIGKENMPKSTYEKYVLFHFPIAIWDQAHKDVVHLHGHVHGTYNNLGRSLDVGVDNIHKLFGEYRPISLDEVKSYMKLRRFIKKSHHDENVN